MNDKMTLTNLFGGIFKDKTVFVTGHTGFIGSWLTEWLCELGANVVGYSLEPTTSPSLFGTLELEKRITHVIGDINNTKNLQNEIQKHSPEIVFHLAAQSLVKQSYENPLVTFQTNIIGTANLLQIIKDENKIKICIIMTSDKCYQNVESSHAYVEDDPVGGDDPYSASKGAAEIITNSYKKSFFVDNNEKQTKIATVRAGNVIGGGDWAPDRIIPDCIKSFTQKNPVHIRHPDAIRPFQYVLEPISGMFCLANKMWDDKSFSESWNFGPSHTDTTCNVKQIVEKVIKNWGGDASYDINNKKSFKESNFLLLNSQKAQNKLNWHPVFDIDKTISETINWYKTHYYKTDEISGYTKNCIQSYVKHAEELKLKWMSKTIE